MIKGCGHKSRGLVTVDTITVGWHMVVGFSCSGIAVVTCRTVIHDALVIKIGVDTKPSRGKNNSGIVTDAALLICRNVINNLGRCDTCVVAGGTIVGVYAQVIKGYARKAGKVVRIVTRRAIQGCR